MAIVGPQLVRRKRPTFADGYAIGPASAGARYWPRLTVAFAPFLGVTGDPTRFLFGKAVRRDLASFSGGRSRRLMNGWGWEFTSTSNFVKTGATNVDAHGFDVPFTMMIGYQKTDGTDRDCTLVGSGGTGTRCSFQRVAAGPGNVNIKVDNDTKTSFTPGAGHDVGIEHVWSTTIATGGTKYASIYVDGERAAFNSAYSPTVSSTVFSVYIGANPSDDSVIHPGSACDLMVVSFVYIWDIDIGERAVKEISADPGLLFRAVPLPRAQRFDFRDIAGDLAGDGQLSGDLTGLGDIAGAAAGDASPSATVTATAEVAGDSSGAGSLTGDLIQTVDGLNASGSAVASATLTGLGDIAGNADGGSDAVWDPREPGIPRYRPGHFERGIRFANIGLFPGMDPSQVVHGGPRIFHANAVMTVLQSSAGQCTTFDTSGVIRSRFVDPRRLRVPESVRHYARGSVDRFGEPVFVWTPSGSL